MEHQTKEVDTVMESLKSYLYQNVSFTNYEVVQHYETDGDGNLRENYIQSFIDEILEGLNIEAENLSISFYAADYEDESHELAASMVEIYTYHIWKSAYIFRFYTEDAFIEGFIDASAKDFSMEKAMQCGEYLAYKEAINDILTAIESFCQDYEFPETETE